MKSSDLTHDQIRAGVAEFGSIAAFAKHKGLKPRRLQEYCKREGIVFAEKPERPSFKQDGGNIEIVGNPGPTMETPEELMQRHGLNPDDWEIANLVVNKWDGNAGGGVYMPHGQIKLFLKPKEALKLIVPAREPIKDFQLPVLKPVSSDKPMTWVFIGDEQAPYHDERLHYLSLCWLNDIKPDRGVKMGDLIDLPDISRHADNPEWHERAQTCVDAGSLIIYERRQASPETGWEMLEGNHDTRVRSEQLLRAERLYNLRPACLPGEEPEEALLSLSRLLRLPQLGVDFTRPNGNYDHAQVVINDKLAARHGWLTGKDAAKKSISRLDHSLVLGHTHRQGVYSETRYRIDGSPYQVHAIETGCMCRIEGGLGYAVDPDWQNGFVTVTVWPDGEISYDFARYRDGVLRWRDKQYRD